MIVSDSNPVQFWPVSLKTFNESVTTFVRKACFYSIFQTSDDLRIDVIADSASFAYNLIGYYQDGSVWDTLPMTQIGTGLHFAVDFNWSSYPEAVNKLVRFYIQESETFVNGDFETGTLTPWHQVADGGVGAWTLGVVAGDKSATMDLTLTGVTGTTRTCIALRHPYPKVDTLSRTFQYKIVTGTPTVVGGDLWSSSKLSIVLYKNGIEVASEHIRNMTIFTATYTGTFTPVTTDFDEIGIRIIYNYLTSSAFSGHWRIDACLFEPIALSSITSFKSDFISVREVQNEGATVLIEYANTSDFDNKDFLVSNAVFKIRIPALFWQDDDVTTQEDFTLSDGSIVSLRADITPKRLLEVDFVPAYMHSKIRKVLMHDINNITIETGERIGWKKMDDYTVSPILRYTSKMATCLLTKKKIVLVNIGGDSGNQVIVEGRIYDYTYDDTYD